MPKDIELPGIQDWIKSFNKLRHWETLVVPKPAEGLKLEPSNRFREKWEAAEEDLKKLKSERRKLEKQLAAAEANLLALETSGDARDKELRDVQTEINRIEKLLEKARTDHKEASLTSARAKRSYTQLTEVAAESAENVETALDQVRALSERLEKDGASVDLDKLDEADKKKLLIFQLEHDNLSQAVDKLRGTLFKDTKRSNNKERTYAVVSSEDYIYLFGLLEQAVLELQLDGVDVAQATLDKGKDALSRIAAARTGGKAIARKKPVPDKLEAVLRDLPRQIGLLRRHAFSASAQTLEDRLDTLDAQILADASDEDALIARFEGQCGALAADASREAAAAEQVASLLAEAAKAIEIMRMNGHKSRPDRIQRRLDKFDFDEAPDQVVSEAIAIRDLALKRQKATIDEDLAKHSAKVDTAKLDERIKDLDGRYDALFKHERVGILRERTDKVKTQTDRVSGQEKGVKKNSDLPRGTIEEIDLQILALKQLRGSGSVEALREADEMAAKVETFLSQIDKDPKIYAKLLEAIEAEGKKLDAIDKDYSLYEVNRRAELRGVIDKLKKDYTTTDAAKVVERIATLRSDIADHKTVVAELRKRKRALADETDAVEKKLKSMGEKLVDEAKKSQRANGSAVKKYYGQHLTSLEALRAQIARRTDLSLTQAEADKETLETAVDKFLTILKTSKSKRKAQEMIDLSFEIDDTVAAQDKHDADLKDKPAAEKAAKALKATIKDIGKYFEKTKSDTSSVEALESQRASLESGADKDGWTKALAGLLKLQERADRMLAEAKEAAETVDRKLPDLAAETAAKVTALKDYAATFYDKVIEPADDAAELDAEKIKKLKAYLKAIADAVPIAAGKLITDGAAVVSDEKSTLEQKRVARKDALRGVRQVMAVVENFPPLNHLASHSFSAASDGGLANLRKTLGRLELRFLTAIRDEK